MSNDYHIAVSAIVDACKGVSALGRKEDPSSSFDTFDTQFCFVEKYSARAFKISVEPCSWLSFSDNDIGVSVSIAFDSALWSSISDRDYADFGAKKKDNRRKNIVGENPDLGTAFDKWWEVVSNICQNDKEGRCNILVAIGYMIALSRTGRCNYKKGSRVSRTTIEKIARASSLRVENGSTICVADIECTLETYLTKCCGAFIVESGEREDAPMPLQRKSSRPKAETWRAPPRPAPSPSPAPRHEPPRKKWEPPPPKPQHRRRRIIPNSPHLPPPRRKVGDFVGRFGAWLTHKGTSSAYYGTYFILIACVAVKLILWIIECFKDNVFYGILSLIGGWFIAIISMYVAILFAMIVAAVVWLFVWVCYNRWTLLGGLILGLLCYLKFHV